MKDLSPCPIHRPFDLVGVLKRQSDDGLQDQGFMRHTKRGLNTAKGKSKWKSQESTHPVNVIDLSFPFIALSIYSTVISMEGYTKVVTILPQTISASGTFHKISLAALFNMRYKNFFKEIWTPLAPFLYVVTYFGQQWKLI